VAPIFTDPFAEWEANRDALTFALNAGDRAAAIDAACRLFPEGEFLSEGHVVARWLALNLRQTKGRFGGVPLVLEPWQYEFVLELYRLDPVTGRRVYQEATLLLPRKNGKSTLAAGLALYHLAADGEASPEVYVAAGSRDQAKVIHNQAKDTLAASPALGDYLKPFQYHIAAPASNGIFRVLASDFRLQHGSNPSANFIDEKWAHKSNDLATALTSGTGARDEPLTVTISTVGHELESPLGEDFTAALKLTDGETRRDGFLTIRRDIPNGYLFWYYGPPCDEAGQPLVDLDDPAVWRACNPASWVTDDYLRRQRHKPSVRPADFQRFHLNAWTEAEEYWLPAGAWKACKPGFAPFASPDDLPERRDLEAEALLAYWREWVADNLPEERPRVFLGVDIGQKRDRAAVVAVRVRELDDGTRLYDVHSKVWTPPEAEGQTLDIAQVRDYVRRWHLVADVAEVAFDPWRFAESAETLADEGVEMVEFPQSNERMCPASVALFDGINSRRVRHSGDAVLGSHVNAGATTETERGWRLTKRKATKSVDALIALCMAYAKACADEGDDESVYEERGLLVL
jgi:phage terminase large subunit-like protein